MKISLITVCHKSREAVSEFVFSFLRFHSPENDGAEYEFVFVENSGQPGLREVVQPLHDAGYTILVVDSENDGFGVACNLGAEHCTGELLVFVNPDVQFASNLGALGKFNNNASWGTVRQLTPRGRMYSLDLLPEHKSLLFELARGYQLVNKYQKIFKNKTYVVGSFLVVEKGLFERVGGFNQAFFLYYEEAELCRRLHLVAGPPFVEQGIEVVHEGFGSQSNPELTFKFECEGFLTYCRVTSQLDLLRVRIRQLRMLGFVSKIARQRYLALKNMAGELGFAEHQGRA